jgi:hypothetical protein
VRYAGVGAPFDGCELQGEYGHRWPDRFGSHSPVELALTARGRAYFADRAAARDLALFVRSRAGHRVRAQPGPELGRRLAGSRIRYRLTAGGVTVSERSPTGKRFVVVVRGGRIRSQNLRPYAFVF